MRGRQPKKVEGGGAPKTTGKTGTLGRELIKHFDEGARLDSIPLPKLAIPGLWVHWDTPALMSRPGHAPIHAGRVLMRLLAGDLKRFEKAVTDLITVPLDQCEFDSTHLFFL